MELLLKLSDILQAGFFERVISLWPFLIVLVVLLLAFLWYHQVKQMRRRQDRYDRKRMIGIINPVILLGIITLLILMLLSFPFFFERLEEAIDEKENDELSIDPKKVYDKTFLIEGMESDDCEVFLEEELSRHYGIKMVKTSYIDNMAMVLYDTTMICRGHITEIIESAGFGVINDD